MDLDVKYLGTKFRLPSWSLLVLGAPAPEKIGEVMLTEGSRASMNFDANWGLVLRVGDRAFEDENYKQVAPYQPGDWVMFEDFHPESRNIHKRLVYFIPDARMVAALEEPMTFEPFLDFVTILPQMAEEAAELRAELLERGKAYQHLLEGIMNDDCAG